MSARILRFPTGQAEITEQVTEPDPSRDEALVMEVGDFMSKVEDLGDLLDNEDEFWAVYDGLTTQLASWSALRPGG